MRVRLTEQAMQGLKALDLRHQGPLDIEIDVEPLCHLLWNGYHTRDRLPLAFFEPGRDLDGRLLELGEQLGVPTPRQSSNDPLGKLRIGGRASAKARM
jgi:hypothetical protein